jgi:organic radical activating enzyme
MYAYKMDYQHTVISTHISPTARCNLKCSYCSVTKRDRKEGIELDVIKKYIIDLKEAGLKACILTGGGEPTLYSHINELIRWLKNEDLEVAMITNGTNPNKIDNWDWFTWVRISINDFPNWEKKIDMPKIRGVLGISIVYVGQPLSFFKRVANLCDKINAKYVRVLPDCLHEGRELEEKHNEIRGLLNKLGDNRFFHQYKIHGSPKYKVCHQSYFRPYLSEVGGGLVFPCDSLVLNEKLSFFDTKYALCKPEQISDYLFKFINQRFDAMSDCKGCVFTENVNMLGDWKYNKIDLFDKYIDEDIKHVNFV